MDGCVISSSAELAVGIQSNVTASVQNLLQTGDEFFEVCIDHRKENNSSTQDAPNMNYPLVLDYSDSCQNALILSIRGRQERILGFVTIGVFRDNITDEIRLIGYSLAKALEFSYHKTQVFKQYSASLLDGFPMCAILLDEYGQIINSNEQCKTLLGIRENIFFTGAHINSILNENSQLEKRTMDNFDHLKEKFRIKAADHQIIPCPLINQHVVQVPEGSNQLMVLFQKE
jgi:transcriptional regulator with PAS, ATPase and Fis domain